MPKCGDDMNDIVSMISSCGFPVFACIWLAKTQAKQIEKLTAIIQENTNVLSAIREELKK